MESQISLLKGKSLYIENYDFFKTLIQLEDNEYLNDDLSINYNIIFLNGTDIELLEYIVRFLVRIKYQLSNETDILIEMKNTPKEVSGYFKWFIKFFGYLEANELGNQFDYNSFHAEAFENEFNRYQFDTKNMKFAIHKIEVELV